jgi:hypothetical protein
MTPDRVMSINAPKKWYHVIILKANKWPFSTWQGKKKKESRLALKKISVILINKAETNREI